MSGRNIRVIRTSVAMMFRSFVLVLCAASSLTASVITGPKCKPNDDACINELGNRIYKKIIDGDAELEMENLSPLRQDKIEGDLSVIKYTLQNSECHGFEKCKINKIEHNTDSLKVKVNFFCPEFVMNGDYEIDGQLIVLPIQGKGPYFLKANDYNITMDGNLKKTAGKDGKTYVSVKKYNFVADLRGYMDFQLKNLFNGREDLAAPVQKFINENFKEVAELLQGPVFSANLKKVVKNLNKLLKSYPIEDMVEL